MKDDRLKRLGALADLVLDGELAALRRAQAAKLASEGQRDGLDRPGPVGDGGLDGAAAALSHLSYQRWADARRSELNRQIARQTVEVEEATDAARKAFGRAQALSALARRGPAKS